MNAVQVVAGMYDARDTVRGVLGAGYEDRIKSTQESIRAGMARWNLGALETILELSRRIRRENWAGCGFTIGILLAAYLDMEETEAAAKALVGE